MSAIEVLRALDALGVVLEIQLPGTWANEPRHLTPDEAERLITLGTEAFWPEFLGTTPELMHRYLDFIGTPGADLRCTAKTRAGRPCGSYMDPYAVPLPPTFTPGVHDRCQWHQEPHGL